MTNVLSFPNRDRQGEQGARLEEITVYGAVGPLSVTLARRTGTMSGLLHVLVLGSAVGIEVVATLPDDANGRAVANFTGPAVLRALELAETEFTARPEAC